MLKGIAWLPGSLDDIDLKAGVVDPRTAAASMQAIVSHFGLAK